MRQETQAPRTAERKTASHWTTARVGNNRIDSDHKSDHNGNYAGGIIDGQQISLLDFIDETAMIMGLILQSYNKQIIHENGTQALLQALQGESK